MLTKYLIELLVEHIIPYRLTHKSLITLSAPWADSDTGSDIVDSTIKTPSMDRITQTWLNTLCTSIQGDARAAVFQRMPEHENYSLFASYPEDLRDPYAFAVWAKNVDTNGQCIVQHTRDTGEESGEPLDIYICPVSLAEQRQGIIVIEASGRAPAVQRKLAQRIENASFWLKAMDDQQQLQEKYQMIMLVELVASCLEHDRFEVAATDVLTELATRLSCSKVSLGFLHNHVVHIAAISHSTGFDPKSGIFRNTREAMYEAIDQDSIIVYPDTTDSFLLTRCHSNLFKENGQSPVLTVPFTTDRTLTGAFLFESNSTHPFEQSRREYIEQIVSMTGPLLEMRRCNEQLSTAGVFTLMRNSLFNRRKPFLQMKRLGIVASVIVFIALTLIRGDYHVIGKARLEADIQRSIVTPHDGYIAAAKVRPGDIIHAGDILGILDDRDLQLEQRKWSNELKQLKTEYRDALARHDRSRVSIIKAGMVRAEAQLNLVEEKLARCRFTAPIDGLVVSGDISQSLGAPVERGQVLFTVAPLDRYRIILEVDERDIGQVSEGNTGRLVLAGMPEKAMSFTVERITPVSSFRDGRNFFRVEAGMNEQSDLFRPGMEGVAKIKSDRHRLIWIIGHRLIDRARLLLWRFIP